MSIYPVTVTVEDLRDFATEVERVWTEWVDEEVIEAAEAAVDALNALADAIENMRAGE